MDERFRVLAVAVEPAVIDDEPQMRVALGDLISALRSPRRWSASLHRHDAASAAQTGRLDAEQVHEGRVTQSGHIGAIVSLLAR